MMPSTISLTNGTRLNHQAASIAKERRSQHKILSSCAGSRVTPAFLVEVVSIGIAALARFPPTLFFACFIKANTIDDCHSMFSIAFEATAYSLRCRHELGIGVAAWLKPRARR